MPNRAIQGEINYLTYKVLLEQNGALAPVSNRDYTLSINPLGTWIRDAAGVYRYHIVGVNLDDYYVPIQTTAHGSFSVLYPVSAFTVLDGYYSIIPTQSGADVDFFFVTLSPAFVFTEWSTLFPSERFYFEFQQFG